MKPPHPVLHTAATLLLALAGAWLIADTAQAQAGQRRLVVDVDLQRQGAVQSGIDIGQQRLSQRWQLSAMLQTDGTPLPYNPLDPEDQRRQLERAQRAQAAATAAPAAAPDWQALQARAQALQARCGQDSACLMREASALSAAALPGVDRATQGRMQAYGQAAAACERQPAGAPREACRAQARRAAGGTPEREVDDTLPTPYLLYTGAMACGLQRQARLDARAEGHFNDVQGAVPFVETARGDETLRDDTPCPGVQAVLDTRSGRVWTALGLVPQDVAGLSHREEKGRKPQSRSGRMTLRWLEAEPWLQQRLNRLSADGSDQARLPVPGGQAEIRLRWSFQPAG